MQAIVLDISRSVSRIGKGKATGIDRVERAYIEHFLHSRGTVYFLARFRRQNVLLDQTGMQALWKLVQSNGPWPRLSLLDKAMKTSGIERGICNFGIGQGRDLGLLRRHIPEGFTYLNVGHGRFKKELWPDLKRAGARKIIVMIHDVIPLDFPQYCRAKTVEPFRNNLIALANYVDTLIYNSEHTASRVRYWLKQWDKQDIDHHVVLLGAEPFSNVGQTQSNMEPYFVCLGTIEPRKNHQLLLDIWQSFHETLPESDIPHLHIIGARGWMNENVFDQMDHSSFIGKTVFEHNNLTDNEVGNFLSGARALLFPSFAEGFGYPLLESLLVNTPAICADIPCLREISNDVPTFIDSNNLPAWRDAILLTTTLGVKSRQLPSEWHKKFSWSQHFHNIDTIVFET